MSHIAVIKNALQKLYKKVVSANDVMKKDGTPRQNSIKERLESSIAEQEQLLATAQEEKNCYRSGWMSQILRIINRSSGLTMRESICLIL
jgi:hypothetical protein